MSDSPINNTVLKSRLTFRGEHISKYGAQRLIGDKDAFLFPSDQYEKLFDIAQGGAEYEPDLTD